MTESKLVYLDACAIIELLEKRTAESSALSALLEVAAGNPTHLLTSELTLTEVLVDPIRGLMDITPWQEGAPFSRDHHDWYLANLTDDSLLVRTRPITRSILTRAALMRARVKSLRSPDAIHAATAYEAGCAHFISGDQRLMKGIERDPAWQTASGRFSFVPLDAAAIEALIRQFDA
ncbi:MAG TPA: PIN domain-containing protein [Bosea sp. (in: a-proteobacteria)]|nr:PIN domain-containing protein [Bosea sp. (in: a-proteobacteria)]